MSVMRAQFQRQLYPLLRGVIMNSYNEIPLQYTQLFRVETSDRAFEEFQSVAGMGLFVKTPEGVEAAQDRFYNGYYTRIDHDEYSLAIGFTHRAQRDFKTRLFGERASDMGRSARSTEETVHAALLNLAHSGTQLGSDGKVLCASDHPNIRGGSQSNTLASPGSVSVVNVRRLLTMGRRYYDDTGVRRITLSWEKLVIPPEEEWAANEVLHSAGRPDTTNRADNVIRGKLTPFVYDYLTDTNDYYMLAAKNQHFLYVFIRDKFYTREYEEEKPMINWIQGRLSCSHGFPHWMGIIGVSVT